MKKLHKLCIFFAAACFLLPIGNAQAGKNAEEMKAQGATVLYEPEDAAVQWKDDVEDFGDAAEDYEPLLKLNKETNGPRQNSMEKKPGMTKEEKALQKEARQQQRQVMKGAEEIARQEKSARKKEEKGKRFIKLLNADGYDYYLDIHTAHWIPMPQSGGEQIIDVWVRLVDENQGPEIRKDQKYYLEHYYVRPKKQQVQFLAELEVTGRPSNVIPQKPYSSKNWEGLIPGSIEYDIYHGVVKHVKPGTTGGQAKLFGGFGLEDLKDALEDYLHIAIT